MLSRIERKIMDLFYEKCSSKKTSLFTPSEIQSYLAPQYELTFKQIEIAVKNLMVDNYIDVYNSDNKGKLNYVISLKRRGEGYQREKEDAKSRRIRSVGWKIVLAVIGSIAVWIFWRLVGSN